MLPVLMCSVALRVLATLDLKEMESTVQVRQSMKVCSVIRYFIIVGMGSLAMFFSPELLVNIILLYLLPVQISMSVREMEPITAVRMLIASIPLAVMTAAV